MKNGVDVEVIIWRAVELITTAEGFRGVEYLCPAGKRTIGYGRNLESNPLTDQEKAKCRRVNGVLHVDKLQARAWVEDEVIKIIAQAQDESWFAFLGAWRQAVVVDIIYNIGLKKWSSFKKCRSALSDKNFGIASEELKDSKWYHQVGLRGERNVEIMRFGEQIHDFYNNGE